MVVFARALATGAPPGSRLARIAAVFTFVSHLVDVPPSDQGEARDGVDALLGLAGEDEGPAVILAALLQAAGERATLEEAGGIVFVAVGLEALEVARLPPHAGLLISSDPAAPSGLAYRLPLDPRQSRSPLGFLPLAVREALLRDRSRYRLAVAT
ncbi:MAG TPA: hypothetical protein VJU18_05330 [Vicinamibacteria bacterium]|nr:hypothetical protein [Vicinamibacteria bacterium]